MSRDLGDWQTPADLAAAVVELVSRDGAKWSRVLEPTCGTGSFLTAAMALNPAPVELIGMDLQEGHLARAREALSSRAGKVRLLKRDIFGIDLSQDLEWATDGPLLVLGNPPWITNSELGSLGSRNLPRKFNIKGMAGLDAVTGAANFDIAECIVLKLMDELAAQRPTIAMLVKTAVARNVLRHSKHQGWPVERASIHRFDARRAFGSAVDACLLLIECGELGAVREIPVFGSLFAVEPAQEMGFSNGELVADMRRYRLAGHLDGSSPVTWRQGVKHDAASVLELHATPEGLVNRLGERVEVEPEHVFPLLKATQLHHGETERTPRRVILPQRSLAEDTRMLRDSAPALWAYLTSHRDVLEARKSRIYRGKPPFSIFGVGDYTFTDYKIAISGLHKEPRFRLVGPVDGKQVVVDDTSYVLPCADAAHAEALFAVLTSPDVASLLKALMFPDSKRPVTKSLLQRIDLLAASQGRDPVATGGGPAGCLAGLSGEIRSTGREDGLPRQMPGREAPGEAHSAGREALSTAR